jgi:hypothetical protein
VTTGTIIMIVCAILYGLIVILFKDDRSRREDDSSLVDDRFVGADGTPGGRGFCSKDFDTPPLE